MNNSLPQQVFSADNERSLKRLVRAIRLSGGRRFSLILIQCNYSDLQTQVMTCLQQHNEIAARTLRLSPSTKTLYTAIKTELNDDMPEALVVLGLAENEDLDHLLLATNQVRDKFNQGLACPLILWVTDEVLKKMLRLAPDFYSWAASPISFRLSSSALQVFLRQKADQLFAVFLTSRHEPSDASLWQHSPNSSLPYQEVEAALHDIQTEDHALEPDLNASLKFVLGQESHTHGEFEAAVEAYDASLRFWQQANHLERQGVLLFCLGRCYLDWAESESPENQTYIQTAAQYFQDCLNCFDILNRLDLKAKFIGYRGESLRRLNRWAELQALVQEAWVLYERYPHPVESARIAAFLAEIDLRHTQNYSRAVEQAKRALQLLEVNSSHYLIQVMQGKYSFLLAEAQQNLQKPLAAINTLHLASGYLSPKENPHLYIRENPSLYIQVLEQLRTLYFDQKQYLKAFHFKHEKLVIESQYGFRAFIGAGRLRARQQRVSNSRKPEAIAEEIAVSGRQKDVERLKERISRNDCVLTILHGQLGVGKSSLIQAGLVPTLEQEPIQARDTLVVLVRSYNNWIEKIWEKLANQLQSHKCQLKSFDGLESSLLQQLRDNENHNFLTVLICDQFEEFFITYNDPKARIKLFEFLNFCLEIPFTKIILSLREDYLHYLLEWSRYANLTSIDDDLLSKSNRYELNNFSSGDTRRVIQKLTNRFHLSLEIELIDRLVLDLSGDADEIRPIELQVVGAQLHEEKIRTIRQYQALGETPKEKLVQNYLEGVVRDCGSENEQAARLVLFLLTGENDTRPSKTREEIETDLKALEKELIKETQSLDLVLEIFKESGLVFLLPETPADRYQLVHDYLVAFIRKQQPRIDELVKKLETQRKQLEAKDIELKLAQLEAQNAENQQKIAEERRKRVESELLAEQNLRSKQRYRQIFIVSSLMIFATSIFSIFSIFLFNAKTREYAISGLVIEQRSFIVDIYNDRAQRLLKDGRVDEAFAEMLEASIFIVDLIRAYQGDEEKFERHGSYKELEDAILTVRNSALLALDKDNNLTNKEKNILAKDLSGLTLEEQHKFIIDLIKIGCSNINQEVFEAHNLVRICGS